MYAKHPRQNTSELDLSIGEALKNSDVRYNVIRQASRIDQFDVLKIIDHAVPFIEDEFPELYTFLTTDRRSGASRGAISIGDTQYMSTKDVREHVMYGVVHALETRSSLRILAEEPDGNVSDAWLTDVWNQYGDALLDILHMFARLGVRLRIVSFLILTGNESGGDMLRSILKATTFWKVFDDTRLDIRCAFIYSFPSLTPDALKHLISRFKTAHRLKLEMRHHVSIAPILRDHPNIRSLYVTNHSASVMPVLLESTDPLYDIAEETSDGPTGNSIPKQDPIGSLSYLRTIVCCESHLNGLQHHFPNLEQIDVSYCSSRSSRCLFGDRGDMSDAIQSHGVSHVTLRTPRELDCTKYIMWRFPNTRTLHLHATGFSSSITIDLEHIPLLETLKCDGYVDMQSADAFATLKCLKDVDVRTDFPPDGILERLLANKSCEHTLQRLCIHNLNDLFRIPMDVFASLRALVELEFGSCTHLVGADGDPDSNDDVALVSKSPLHTIRIRMCPCFSNEEVGIIRRLPKLRMLYIANT